MLSNSRFNPTSGVLDFWTEFRKPNPLRIPILIVSMAPFALIFYWLAGETFYPAPERPTITYITTLEAGRTDAEITASNLANQEVKDLREQAEADLAERKREIYKALGAAAGMDVDEIERRADANRAAEAAAREAERAAMFGDNTRDRQEAGEQATGERAADAPSPGAPAATPTTPRESSAP